ncbi:hypothetical protein ACJIZ3_017030 [Penstemon smallii]|uniref:F-box domain-containing protein n=1 Tax=Penstemon smallii TaxID=265156 RepID=A0ABD3SVK2_9LAMI
MNPTTQEQDSFDSLPDDIVLSIFNKLQDAKSLCSSMSACKRFHSVAPRVAQIFLPIPHKNRKSQQQQQQQIQKGFFKNVLIKTLFMFKPFQFISQMIKLKSKNDSEDSNFQSFHIPIEVLKSFQQVRGLHLRLPCYGTQNLGSKSEKNNTFLKWKAEFGKELHSCVMIGSKSLSENTEEKNRPESRVITDDELKLRIVWTISCLIAASARHYLIQETVKEQKLIENVVVSDESEQGMLCMNKEQIQELKEMKGKGNNEDSILLEYRSKVPALRMKMWYLDKLELEDSGKVMEGATLEEEWRTQIWWRVRFAGKEIRGRWLRKLQGNCWWLRNVILWK